MKTPELRAGLDTSVLVRLLTGDPEPLFNSACGYLAETQERNERLLVSNLVICEAYFACQHHYRMPKAEALGGLQQVLSDPLFLLQTGVLELLSTDGLATAKPGFVDRLIHAEYRAAGTRLVTFEKPAKRLGEVDLLG